MESGSDMDDDQGGNKTKKLGKKQEAETQEEYQIEYSKDGKSYPIWVPQKIIRGIKFKKARAQAKANIALSRTKGHKLKMLGERIKKAKTPKKKWSDRFSKKIMSDAEATA